MTDLCVISLKASTEPSGAGVDRDTCCHIPNCHHVHGYNEGAAVTTPKSPNTETQVSITNMSNHSLRSIYGSGWQCKIVL